MAGTEKRQKTAIIYARVKPEVKAMLEAQAEAQGRSLANYLEWIARQHNQQGQQRQTSGVR
jgi:predicted HicB family RNase H-like nuclease